MKQYVGWARVSSESQKREGFSLEDQGEKLKQFADRMGGKIVQLFSVAETASKRQEREGFRDLIAYAKRHASRLSGILFLRVDRASRNLEDWCELERLEKDHGVRLLFPDQPTGDTPTGRFQRRISAVVAAHQTDQQAESIRDGKRRRAESGLFPGAAPYGYQNHRIDGRGMVRLHPENAAKVRRIFNLYAYGSHTLDTLREQLFNEGILYTSAQPKFDRSSLHRMLVNRSYVGEVSFRGQWLKGTHEPLVDATTFKAVQDRMGKGAYHHHALTYAGELIACNCGHPITGERKVKKSRGEQRVYTYYRCARYNRPGHPRTRVTEGELDAQVMAAFDKMRVEDQLCREWFAEVIRARAAEAFKGNEQRVADLRREMDALVERERRLVHAYIDGKVNEDELSSVKQAIREQMTTVKANLEACDQGRESSVDLAIKAFELSQNLKQRWLNADYRAKRTILEIVCLNLTLEGTSLVVEMRKPFSLLAEGLIPVKDGAMGI